MALPVVDTSYIQHPESVPLKFTEVVPQLVSKSNAKQWCGIAFSSNAYVAPAKWLHVSIAAGRQNFEFDAQVRWCERAPESNGFTVGVDFNDKNAAFTARMAEQVCHIADYKQNVEKQQSRPLSSQQAALEWIEKFADKFPSIDTSHT